MCFIRFWRIGIQRGYVKVGNYWEEMNMVGTMADLCWVQYPLSERMMRPASNPNYYDGLLKELNEAPTRSWFQSMVNRWKGSLRFS